MKITADIMDSVLFFQHAFTVILALALTEAFKQFVKEDHRSDKTLPLHWDRLPALLSFLFLIFPFFHGMSRYFFYTYLDTSKTLPSHYAVWLVFDSIAFTIESGLFFAMARTLARSQWRNFNHFVLVLLAVDTVWAFVSVFHEDRVLWWAILNLVFAVVILSLLHFRPAQQSVKRTAFIFLGIVIIRTLLDYGVMWTYFFPKGG